MNATNDALAWVKRAEEDYIMAQSAIRRKQPLKYSACFHAQQCAEKYLKALLTPRNVAFPKVHDLLLLHTLCEQSGLILALSLKDLDMLSAYAVQVRYPGDEPAIEDAKDAVRIAKNVRRICAQLLLHSV